MAKLTLQEKLERKRILEEKREARRVAKEQKEQEKKTTTAVSHKSIDESSAKIDPEKCYISKLPDDALNHIFWFTSARDMGVLAITSRSMSKFLLHGRVSIILSRLSQTKERISFCSGQTEAEEILNQSYEGGDTGRIELKGKARKEFANEFVTYARFLEEAVCGHATQNYGGKTPVPLPSFVNGRFVSVSPEHSISRVGGGDRCGGGSGVASWGVGKRGQLGNGKRSDEKTPKILMGGIGYYGIRIVQVSAGGGLVRVAHTLLLTSTGRVLSFGVSPSQFLSGCGMTNPSESQFSLFCQPTLQCGQYGALGHGYSGGKQLPDILRPQYIEALAGTRIVCVSAGEIHSAAVSVDGDVYTWVSLEFIRCC